LVFGSALVLEALARYQRAALSALHFGGVGLGIAFSAILVAQIDSFGFDWRMQWFACALTIAIATIAVALLVKQEDNHGPVERQSNSNDPQDKTAASGPPPAPGGSSLKALIIAYGLFGFGYVITATFISTMVRTEPDIRFLEPFIWLIVGLAGVPSVFIWSAVARRFGTAAGFSLACLIEAGAVAVSVLGSGPVAMIIAALLLGGTFMGITALGLIRAREFNLQDSRKVLGLMTVAFSVGQMIGPTFAGYTWSFGNSFLFPSMTAATGLLIAAALTGLYKKSTA
jgi:predicted MFS family arabinose efflux permease